MYYQNAARAMVHRPNHQWLATLGPGKCFWSFLTKQDQVPPSHVYGKTQPHSAQFWLGFCSISTFLGHPVFTGLLMEFFYVYQFKPNRLTGLRMENIPVNFLHIKRQMSNLIVDLSASIFRHLRKRSTRISCVYKVLEHSGSVTISYVLRRNILSPPHPS